VETIEHRKNEAHSCGALWRSKNIRGYAMNTSMDEFFGSEIAKDIANFGSLLDIFSKDENTRLRRFEWDYVQQKCVMGNPWDRLYFMRQDEEWHWQEIIGDMKEANASKL
jgi:hypothetical protein